MYPNNSIFCTVRKLVYTQIFILLVQISTVNRKVVEKHNYYAIVS